MKGKKNEKEQGQTHTQSNLGQIIYVLEIQWQVIKISQLVKNKRESFEIRLSSGIKR